MHKKNFYIYLFFVGILKVKMMKIEGFGSASRFGSIGQRHGSADPEPHQNVMDPQHCWIVQCSSNLENLQTHFQMKNMMMGGGVEKLKKFGGPWEGVC